jgi:acyl carrier protein
MKLSRYIEIIEFHLNVPDRVTALSSFKDNLGADSLDMVELVITLEEEIGIDLPDDIVDEDNVGLLYAEVLRVLNTPRSVI